ncbi:MAG: DUF3791 domain-containing protein [Lachnospiraceae bacterium]|nr:DUF3791 domain-containing protein [Lachnospiraceae bacterium]
MIDEVLFLEARVFNEFLRKHNMKPKEANQLFEKYGIWNYLEECYDILHMNGDEYILYDVELILERKGGFA